MCLNYSSHQQVTVRRCLLSAATVVGVDVWWRAGDEGTDAGRKLGDGMIIKWIKLAEKQLGTDDLDLC